MQNGFTIIELLFVTLILAVLAGVAVPRLNRPRVDAAARDLSMTLLAAQNRALLLQQDVQVRFDTVAGRVVVVEAPGSADERWAASWDVPSGVSFGPGPTQPLAIGERAVTFQDDDGAPTLTFHRGGAASEWGGAYLRGHGPERQPDILALEVDRATGRVTVWHHGADGWRLP